MATKLFRKLIYIEFVGCNNHTNNDFCTLRDMKHGCSCVWVWCVHVRRNVYFVALCSTKITCLYLQLFFFPFQFALSSLQSLLGLELRVYDRNYRKKNRSMPRLVIKAMHVNACHSFKLNMLNIVLQKMLYSFWKFDNKCHRMRI